MLSRVAFRILHVEWAVFSSFCNFASTNLRYTPCLFSLPRFIFPTIKLHLDYQVLTGDFLIIIREWGISLSLSMYHTRLYA